MWTILGSDKLNLYRETYVEVNLKRIKDNVQQIVEKFNHYNYYFGVVKANCYGHKGLPVVEAVINGGCNYLAVATLEEALQIRKKFKEIPILCLGIIPTDYIRICNTNNITITINSLMYAKKLTMLNIENLKVHIKINS